MKPPRSRASGGTASRFPVVWIPEQVTSREPTPSRLCSGAAENASFLVNAHRIPQPRR